MPDAPYVILDASTLPAYLATLPEVMQVLGQATSLHIDEIGDGNLNFVYRVCNANEPTRAVIVKQAVPFLRMAGESWPLSRERMTYEIRALGVYNDLVPGLVPECYHADEAMSTLVMQCLDDHRILRTGMIEGVRYPRVAADIGRFMAQTLFRTSAWAMDSADRRALIDRFTMNAELCKLTEDFIFTFPYLDHPSNYSNPATDAWAREHIRTDARLKLEALTMKTLFVTRTDALLHADLHSGSMMVNVDDTYVIDMEFAFFGPMGFDVGKVIGNFLLCCTSHYHRGGGAPYRAWLLEQIAVVWSTFDAEFNRLWCANGASALLADGALDDAGFATLRKTVMRDLLREAAGFAGCSMIRRTLGIAGVADIRDIEDTAIRSRLEIANLMLGKQLLQSREQIDSMDDLMSLVRTFHDQHDLETP